MGIRVRKICLSLDPIIIFHNLNTISVGLFRKYWQTEQMCLDTIAAVMIFRFKKEVRQEL